MNLVILLLIILLLFGGIGVAPSWGYHNYGWYPASGIGLILLIIILWILLGRS